MPEKVSERETARRERFMTVYPSHKAIRVLSRGSVPYNLALECWAAQLLMATLHNEKALTPAQWECLRDNAQGFQPSPWGQHIAQGLAGHLSQSAYLMVSRTDRAMAEAVARVVGKMDYAHAWAAWWSCAYGGDAGEWWKLSDRSDRSE